MNDQDKIRDLAKLKDHVPFDEIPDSFKTDFLEFITGQAIIKRNDRFSAMYHDFLRWVELKGLLPHQ